MSVENRDRDVDNMSKGAQDAFCRAVGLNDRFVQHLDVVKLTFYSMEEWMFLRTASSYLNDHDEVIAPILDVNWAATEPLEI